METTRVQLRNWYALRRVISLLIALISSGKCTRLIDFGDYTSVYNHETSLVLGRQWQRPRFFTSLGWTRSSWLRERYRKRNRIRQRRSSGRASREKSSTRHSIVSSTIWKAQTRSSWTRARSSGPSPAIRSSRNYYGTVSGSTSYFL